MNIETLYQRFQKNPVVKTDTRQLHPGDIFFALKGPNFNGNAYAQQALDMGASSCIVDEETGIKDDRIIKVNDCMATLQQLAKHHRKQFKIPIIAITGSNGKTTTKELVHAVLSSQFITYTTEGNLNNHIGIPLTLLRIKSDAQMAVVEMGANHQKEIEGYCTYTLPTHGLITNCGKAHLEGFGGEEGVKKGKGELFDYLRSSGGTAFVFWDYEYLQAMSAGIKEVIRFGTAGDNLLVKGNAGKHASFMHVNIDTGASFSRVNTQLVGEYNLPNVLTAICLGKYFGVPDDKIKVALENYVPSNSRSQLIQRDSNTFILDAYNANPSSMKLAIENFAGLAGDKKVLLLGEMKEMGNAAAKEHEQLIAQIQKYKWHAVVLVGENFRHYKNQYHYFDTAIDAKSWFESQSFTNTFFLVKGSRSTQMEKVLG